MMFGSRLGIPQEGRQEAHSENGSATANFRKFYSPEIRHDPYVQSQWRKVVDELDAQCRHSGERCAEAKAAHHWLSEQR
jgi:hypothetical protein